MSQLFPQEKLAEIQQASDIVSVISQYVTLKKIGKSHKGLCPFHGEKTPSFTVNAERRCYKCFGCGESGTVFTFLMKHDGLTFPDAVKELAHRAGIALPEVGRNKQINDENELLYKINDHFTKFYHDKLINCNSAEAVRRYCSGRGINRETVKRFSIGFAPNGWDAALNEGRRMGFDVRAMEDAGIVLARKKGGGHYDRFRGRLMFPILDVSGRVVGFGARTLEDSDVKYVNSPESRIFNKRRILYGLNIARGAITGKNEAIVMEGYTDVVMAHKHGIDYSVGVMGTSLTLDHVKLIKRYCKRVVLVLDADTAGIKSAGKSAGIFIENGLDVRIAQLPEGSDPCEVLMSSGKESFLTQLESADSFFDFRLKIAEMRNELDTVAGKAEVFREIITAAIKIPDIIKRNVQIKEIAGKTEIDEADIRRYLERDGAVEQRRRVVSQKPPEDKIPANVAASVRGKRNASRHVEENLIRLMVSDDKFVPLVRNEIGLDNFLDETLRRIAAVVFEAYEKGSCVTEADLFAMLAGTGLDEVLADVINIDHGCEDNENVYAGCRQYLNKRLSRIAIKTAREKTSQLDSECRGGGSIDSEGEDINQLLERFHEENKRLQSFKRDPKKLGLGAA